MSKTRTAILRCLVAVVLIGNAGAAPATNLNDPALQTEFTALEFGTQDLSYDASIGRLSFTSIGAPTNFYANYPTGAAPFVTSPTLISSFESVFTWTARVSHDGTVADPGSMLWLGNFGSGYEVLASGELDAVNNPYCQYFSPSDGGPKTICGPFQFEFQNNYVSPAIAGFGNHLLMLWNMQLDISAANPVGPYDQSFNCMFGFQVYSGYSCGNFDDTGLVGQNIKVPEPSTVEEFGIALAAIALGFGWRRRPRLSAAVWSRVA